MAKILVVFYSMYGHTETMAKAIVDGAKTIADSAVILKRVPELMPQEILEKSGAKKPDESIGIAAPNELADYDAIIVGTPTRFGNMCAQMRNFFDQTGGLWAKNALVGKVGSVFTSSNTQHGGQESTILSVHTTLLHHGMLICGVPYTCKELSVSNEICGGSPYGASTIAGSDGKRSPSAAELEIAKFQGQRVAEVAKRLFS
jgi:NAD(P)H dehydrogenase (quinone)